MGGLIGFMYRQLSFTPKPLSPEINLHGKTAIVTGGNVGLGLESAKQLASRGLSRVILAVRTPSKGEAARQEILRESPSCDVQVWQLDQESFDSMREFGERAKSLDRLDIVILCAGVKLLEFTKSDSGHEMNVQVNHLGTALLSLLLLEPLQRTAKTTGTPSRLTIVTSEVHFWTEFKERTAPNTLARMDEPDSFGQGMDRYNTSKLLNVLWLRELSSKAGPDVIINGVNPGLCASSLHRSDTTPGINIFNNVFAWTPAQGEHCLVDAAVRHPDDQGVYLSEQMVKQPSPFVLSVEGDQAQTKIWNETLSILQEGLPGVNLLHTLRG
ncbi:dehydrogenase [Aspergillus sclerotioniger CBS 115572]|uniref:Dehydrogenase n=1 Tax=Aspergillus sclerotioniger CBS 115572 TaxID=1450535 RepID=A0A317WC89_9EURO|nr:dehydrogenase [Aspergillus sclerotioniger CBS 115572]PWY81750.1 dehydrogenase [Aspergillus sclerotioniger CBS 115572]